MKYLSLCLLVITFALGNVDAQQATVPNPVPRPSPTPRVPGDIVLLNDYVHEVGRGIDTRVGSIRKLNGLEVRYDIGPLAGTAASMATLRASEVAWYKGQVFGEDELWITGLKNGRVIATFVRSDANFFASPANQEEFVDFFLMLMTFKPDLEYIRKRSQLRSPGKP